MLIPARADAKKPRTVKVVTIYTDGACEGNPGPGGWATVLRYGTTQKPFSGGELATTNNRMEIKAALEGLRQLKESCEVQLFTDSEYLKNGITAWIFAWKRKKWKKGGKPVKNADLWQDLDKEASRHKITWNWVRGHSGDPLNELCDQLAVLEIAKLKNAHSKEELTHAMKEFQVKQNSKPWLDPAVAGPPLFEFAPH